MDRLTSAVAHFMALVSDAPLPDGPTREYLAALRAFLDVSWPNWRTEAFDGAPEEISSIDVEFPVANGLAIRGTLVQRPSRASSVGR